MVQKGGLQDLTPLGKMDYCVLPRAARWERTPGIPGGVDEL